MILQTSIKVKNYKCFADLQQGFEKIYPINIIIGKNNSGKSSLLDLVDYAVKQNQQFYETGRGRNKSEVWISGTITEEVIRKSIPDGISGGGIPGPSHFEYGMSFVNSKIEYTLNYDETKRIVNWERHFINNQENYVGRIEANLQTPLNESVFKRINAERDIKPEGADDSKTVIDSSGQGATNTIRRIINNAKYDEGLIQNILLEKLNEITSPEIKFTQILPKHFDNGLWEICFKDANNNSIPLSKMGSGIKTILLVLLNLLVLPEIEGNSREKLVFGFEELENNLHPSLQRRLFNFIIEFAEQNKCYFFITTHSSIVIDLFGQNQSSQILYVENDGRNSMVRTLVTECDGRTVLKGLDYKASDILLSNGVIWVEGPSDAIYLELFFDLYRKKIGYSKSQSFCIQSLSTAIWKYAGFTEFNWEEINTDLENKIISLAKVNHNHLIVLDNDGNYEDKRPSDYSNFNNGIGKNKARLINESIKYSNHDESQLESNDGDCNNGQLFFWVNEGTFETYLKHFILNGGTNFNKYFDLDEDRCYFEKKREGDNASKSKVELAADIAKFALKSNLCFEDFAPTGSALENKIQRLFKTIKSWN